jgi:nicotinamide-nucleotide amidase
MRAEIIASGTELLLGEAADTNTGYIANQLAMLGIDLFYASIVGDNFARFLGVLKQAQERSDIVIITGGLGPTKGDITREVIAGLSGEVMQVDAALKQHISAYFQRMGFEMPENNLKQAMLIPSARAITNPLGTAPGWWVEKNGKIMISLPGPPAEMQLMWQKEVLPRLKSGGGTVILSRTLKTWGLSEARVDQLVGQYMSMSDPTLAIYAKSDGIQLRITAKASDRVRAVELINRRETDLRQILTDSIWGTDYETLEEVVGHLVICKQLTLAVFEAFTGGLLACSLTSLPESRSFFKGGIVAVDAISRVDWGVQPNTGSAPDIQSAVRMAIIAREKFKSDIGIGIDGIIESAENIPGGQAYIAISCQKKESDIALTYSWRPHQLGRRAVMHTLFNLRKLLINYK